MTIEEIPLDNQETVEDIQENVEEIQDIPEKVEEAAPKKRGRPAGAKNKKKIEEAPIEVKQAPVITKVKASLSREAKVKAIPKKKKKPIVEEYSSSEDEAPRVRAQEIDRQALASEMLQMLSQQRNGRATARREHYATWFQ